MRKIGIVLAVLVVLAGAALAVFHTPDIPVATLRAKYGSPTSQYVELTPGSIIHLRDEGPRDGLPVMLLHGSNASLHTWEPWRERLVARGYRVISFDFPGHGLSSPVPSRDYSAEAYAGVVQQVADHLKLDRFVLGGNSMGGGVSWLYAKRHPERLLGLVLVDASGAPPKGKQDLPLGFRLARTPVIRQLAMIVTPRSLMEKSFRQSVSNQAIATPAMVDRYWELLRYPGNREATLDRFAGYKRVAPEPPVSLTIPAVILWGREDRLIPVESASFFSSQLPNGRVTILDNIGHIPMEEAPDRSLAPVLAMLDKVSAAKTPTQTASATP